MRLNFIFSLLSQTGPRFELTLLVLQLLSRWTRAGIIHVRAARAPACERRTAAADWRVLVQPSVRWLNSGSVFRPLEMPSNLAGHEIV